MITTAEEAAEFVALVYAVGLRRAGLMIEVPAAPESPGHIVPRVDFVRVGTDGLTQCTYAADRMHGGVAELNHHSQPAASRLIETSAAQGRRPDARRV